jgi:aspartate/methionine/tyrosine aminotransferase
MFSPLEPFKLERYFAQHEFFAQMLLCTSDCESMTVDELCDLDRKHGGDGGQLGSTWLGYTESRGNPVLREAISKLYTDMTPDSVLLHSGAEEAILNFYLAMIRPGQTVIVNTPCYQSLREIPRALGAMVLPWELRLDDAGLRWALDMAELRSLLGSAGHNPLVVLNMPHNPTGALLSRDEFEELVRLCRFYGATLFMDEVYRNLEFDEADRLPAACEAYEKAVSLSVLSKAWGLAGLRIG